MHYTGRLLSLFAITCLGLSACLKQVPIEDDMNQKRAAIAVAQKYMSALEQQEFEAIMALSTTPYWLDGDIVQDREVLEKMWREALSSKPNTERFETVNARFYSKADLEFFAPRLLEQLQEKQMPAGEYFVVLQFVEAGVDAEPDADREGVLFLMHFEDGKWHVNGLSD